MPRERPVPNDVRAWIAAYDAWREAQRHDAEPHSGLTELKDALLEEILEARGVTPTRRPERPPRAA